MKLYGGWLHIFSTLAFNGSERSTHVPGVTFSGMKGLMYKLDKRPHGSKSQSELDRVGEKFSW
jgi:hypothetical protein